MILLLSLYGFGLIGLAYCVYLGIRIYKVAVFRRKLLNMSHEYNHRRIVEGGFRFDTDKNAYMWFSDKWTFSQMLFSFKPLKLEYWFTEDELKEINR